MGKKYDGPWQLIWQKGLCGAKWVVHILKIGFTSHELEMQPTEKLHDET